MRFEDCPISRAITTGFPQKELDVVVVCNGCTDGTANTARRFGSAVRVIETDVASKVHALNLGDQVARSFPRVYIDADVVITADAIRAIANRLEQGDVLAVAPTPNINVAGSLCSCARLFRHQELSAVVSPRDWWIWHICSIGSGPQTVWQLPKANC